MRNTIESIIRFNAGLLPEIVSIKYAYMLKNMYNFYRGTCHLFYEDLEEVKKIPHSPVTWICGDLHLENFGSYKGDNRLVYFDLNDFDEAVLAPAKFELLRFVTSIFIAFDSIGIERRRATRMAQLFLKSYSETLSKGKCTYIEYKTAKGIVANFLQDVNKRKKIALINKRTKKYKDGRVIRTSEKHIRLDEKLKKDLCKHLSGWIQFNNVSPYNFQVTDVVFRVAGLGSLGLKRYLFLLKSTNANEKYLLVDMKQARQSSVLKMRKSPPQPAWATEAHRIISIQQRMQNVSPALLSSTFFNGEHYMIQEMQHSKDGIRLDLIKNNYRDVYQVIHDMGLLTASAQLRSSGRQGSAICDELIEFGQRRDWQKFVIDYSFRYSLKVKKDYAQFRRSNLVIPKKNKVVQH